MGGKGHGVLNRFLCVTLCHHPLPNFDVWTFRYGRPEMIVVDSLEGPLFGRTGHSAWHLHNRVMANCRRSARTFINSEGVPHRESPAARIASSNDQRNR